MAEIGAGRYAVGEQLPTEAVLCDRFGVSRHTVRQALRELKEFGVVSAHPGIGTWVRARQPEPSRFVHGASSVEDLLQVSRATRLRLVEHQEVVADAALAGFLGCRPGKAWLRLRLLRVLPQDERPVAVLTTYILPEAADILPRIAESPDPIFVMIEQAHGLRVVEIAQEITPVRLEAEPAALLGAEPGEAALRMIRRFRDERDEVLQVADGLYPAGRFIHSAVFRLRRGGEAAPPEAG
ncbi:GntR family transcriptional regulator [Roseomonas sp. OT10]|nr:GntR family transcriptional regulator [Roseomonas sp. OT10]